MKGSDCTACSAAKARTWSPAWLSSSRGIAHCTVNDLHLFCAAYFFARNSTRCSADPILLAVRLGVQLLFPLGVLMNESIFVLVVSANSRRCTVPIRQILQELVGRCHDHSVDPEETHHLTSGRIRWKTPAPLRKSRARRCLLKTKS